jgi:trk system potassium uptake protein TrkH
VLRALGSLLIAFAAFMLLPLLVAPTPLRAPGSLFVLSALATAFCGLALVALSPASTAFELNRRQGFLITALAWTVMPAFGALPLMGYGLTFTDAYFEAASGMTTTGSTVMVGLDSTAPAILLWRSLMQGIGGIGVIVFGIIMMPFLRIGGMQLFHTESSDTHEKIVAKAFDLAIWIVGIYLLLWAACVILYRAVGTTWFDAVNHGFTTISTGGFSTHDASFGYFNSGAMLWVGALFMMTGALPFVAYIRLARGKIGAFLRDVQLRAFVTFLAAAVLVVAATRTVRAGVPFGESLTSAAFNIVSIVTTTGYASEDYQLWGAFAFGAFFIFTFVGGCTGSTAGGVKIYRFQILAKLAGAHLTRIVSPNRVTPILYHDRKVDDDIAFAILAFLVVMLFSVIVSTFLLSWIGVDFVTALTGSATAFANVGPGLGEVIGPAGNFQPLPAAAKWVLSVMMILGRLEFFTLLVLLTPAFWRP